MQGLHIAMLQGAADAWHQGLAVQGTQAGRRLLVHAARAMLMPPGVVPGEAEGQEPAVLGEGWGVGVGPGQHQGQSQTPPTAAQMGSLRRARGTLPSRLPCPGPLGSSRREQGAPRPSQSFPCREGLPVLAMGPGSHPVLQEGLPAQDRPPGHTLTVPWAPPSHLRPTLPFQVHLN